MVFSFCDGVELFYYLGNIFASFSLEQKKKSGNSYVYGAPLRSTTSVAAASGMATKEGIKSAPRGENQLAHMFDVFLSVMS